MERSRAKTEKILEGNFPSLKNKKIHPEKFLIFMGKRNFLAPSLKNFFHSRRELAKPENQNLKLFLS